MMNVVFLFRCLFCLLLAQALAKEKEDGGGFWTQFPLSMLQFPSMNSSSKGNFTLQRFPVSMKVQHESKVCLYDPVSIHWNMTSSFENSTYLNPYDCSIAFSLTGETSEESPLLVTSSSIMQQQEHVNKHQVNTPYQSPLQCLLDKEHCQVTLDTVKVDSNSVDGQGDVVRKLVLSFSTATTEPELYTAQSLNDIFEFHPPLGGEEYGPAVGEWIDPNVLRISTSEQYIEDLIAANSAGTAVISIRRDAKKSPNNLATDLSSPTSNEISVDFEENVPSGGASETFHGIFKLRFPQQGEYKLFVINSHTKRLLSTVHKIKVNLCGDNIVSHDLNFRSKFDSNDVEETPPRPLVRHSGVLAVSGLHPVIIPHSMLPPVSSNGGSFSISFWIRLLESATGKFRALFYKGDGVSPNRTPSAWLIPTSNRVALRSTTKDTPDLGADTTISIPNDQWTHLCFIFHNQTKKNATNGYKIVAYVNGKLDISIGYSTEVIPNNSSLQLFHDISHSGPRSFVADFVVWDSPLTSSHVKNLASTVASSFNRWTKPVDIALDLMKNTLNIPVDPNHKEKEFDNGMHTNTDNELETSLIMISEDKHYSYDLLLKSLPEPAITPLSTAPLNYLLQEIQSAVESCASPSIRLDLYAEAASLGHLESLYHWALLIGFGSEKSVSKCGIESFDENGLSVKYNNDVYPMDIVYDRQNEKDMKDRGEWTDIYALPVADQVKSAVALILAAQAGYTAALVPLSTLLSSGIGVVPLLNNIQGDSYSGKKSRHILAHIFRFVPIPVNLSIKVIELPQCSEIQSVTCLPARFREGLIVDTNALLFVELPLIYRLSEVLRRSSGLFSTSNFGGEDPAYNTALDAAHSMSIEGYEIPMGDSVFSWASHFSDKPHGDVGKTITKLVTGLLLLAAVDDHPDAVIALQKRYQHGLGGVEVNLDISAYYSKIAAITSSDEYFKVGAQPIMENDRISDDTEFTVLEGNTGKDDEIVQTYMVQASEGDVGSMLALGEMNYYGTRGIPRNQARALEYYNQAAELGDIGGLCGAAGMYIKGEGTEKNVTKAVEMYETAASQGSVRALNGLGFFYFFGDSDTPANHTKAFHYFLTATEQHDGDSDSWFNAGYCIEHGLGTEPDLERAATFYTAAAKKFGHFGSIVAMGNMHYEGRGVMRSVNDAVYYLGVANDVGPWMGWLRRGFDQFVQGGKHGILAQNADSKYIMRSTLCYLHAGELGGFEVSQSNAAYLLQRKMSQKTKHYYIGSNLYEEIVASNQLLLDTTVDSKRISNDSPRVQPEVFTDRLLLRELALSSSQGNANSAYNVGSLLLAGRNGDHSVTTNSDLPADEDFGPGDAVALVMNKLDEEYSISKYLPSSYTCPQNDMSMADVNNGVDLNSHLVGDLGAAETSNTKGAITWFSKASAMNSALASFQLGLMYHFGIGDTPVNFPRASRYYAAAISNEINQLHPSLKVMAQITKWMVDDGNTEVKWPIFQDTINGFVGWLAKKMIGES